MVEVFTLAVQHSYHVIAHHERYGQLRASVPGRQDIARIFGDVGGVDRAFLLSCGSGNSRSDRQPDFVVTRIPANLAVDVEVVFVAQKNGNILQVEIVAHDRKYLLEYPIQIKRGQYRLTGVVEDGYLLHWVQARF